MKSLQPLAVIGSILLGLIVSGTLFFSNLKTDPAKYQGLTIVNPEIKQQAPQTFVKELKPKIKSGKKQLVPLKELHSVNDLFFNYHSKFLVWIFVFCLLVGISFGFILPVSIYTSRLKKCFSLTKSHMRWSSGIALVLLIFSLFIAGGLWLQFAGNSDHKYHTSFVDIMIQFEILLNSPRLIISLLILLSSIGPALAIRGIFVINHCIQQLNVVETNQKPLKTVAKDFKLLQEKLDFFLLAVAIIVSGNGITTAFGRDALMQAIPFGHEVLFPIEFVYLYGVSFTFFLAIYYLPIRMQLKRKGALILEEVQSELESHVNEGEEKKFKKEANYTQADLEELKPIFGMTSSTNFDTAKVILSIAGPLLTTVAGKLIGF